MGVFKTDSRYQLYIINCDPVTQHQEACGLARPTVACGCPGKQRTVIGSRFGQWSVDVDSQSTLV